MDYNVRPQHLYSHSRTCTHRNCVEDFPNWWHSIYATSLIMTVFMRFHLSWLDSSICQIFPATMEILICYIFSHYGDHGPLYIFIMEILIYVYCMWQWPHMSCCMMPIHGHCTLKYPGLLYVFIVICKVVSLYSADWVPGFHWVLHHFIFGMEL